MEQTSCGHVFIVSATNRQRSNVQCLCPETNTCPNVDEFDETDARLIYKHGTRGTSLFRLCMFVNPDVIVHWSILVLMVTRVWVSPIRPSPCGFIEGVAASLEFGRRIDPPHLHTYSLYIVVVLSPYWFILIYLCKLSIDFLLFRFFHPLCIVEFIYLDVLYQRWITLVLSPDYIIICFCKINREFLRLRGFHPFMSFETIYM